MKLLKVLVAALVLAAMVTPAIAEDRLSLSGEMRVRTAYVDQDSDIDTDDSTSTTVNQRLRIGGKIAVAEGVSITFRTDITEGTNWGDSSNFQDNVSGAIGPVRTNGYGHARSGAQQQWDRAHLDFTKGMFHVRAGQQFVGTFGTFAVDTQDSGVTLDVKTAVPFSVYLIVNDENTTAPTADFVLDPDTGAIVGTTPAQQAGSNGSDAFLYGVTVKPTIGETPAKFFVWGQNDGSDEDVFVIGASSKMDFDAVKLFAELDVFTGDASETVDAFGTQLFLDASLAASDSMTVGGQIFYALGDDDPTEQQYTYLGNSFNTWDPIMDVGTSLSNEEIPFTPSGDRLFDFTNESAGVVAARLYGNFKVSDALSLGASVAYITVEEDALQDEDAMALAGGLVYTILPNTTFQLQLEYVDGSVDKNASDAADIGDYDTFAAASGLFVKF